MDKANPYKTGDVVRCVKEFRLAQLQYHVGHAYQIKQAVDDWVDIYNDQVGSYARLSAWRAPMYFQVAEPAPAQDALRKRFDEIEFEVAQGRHTAASVFTQMRTAAMSTRPAQTEQSAVVQFGIRVEKLLCSKLGIEWTATGISIESLVDRLAERAAQTEQQRAVLPEGWSLKRVDPEDGVGFIIESPRRNGVSSGAAIWSDAENPAEQMLALILDKVTK